jgi:hypothetical protein
MILEAFDTVQYYGYTYGHNQWEDVSCVSPVWRT